MRSDRSKAEEIEDLLSALRELLSKSEWREVSFLRVPVLDKEKTDEMKDGWKHFKPGPETVIKITVHHEKQ